MFLFKFLFLLPQFFLLSFTNSVSKKKKKFHKGFYLVQIRCDVCGNTWQYLLAASSLSLRCCSALSSRSSILAARCSSAQSSMKSRVAIRVSSFPQRACRSFSFSPIITLLRLADTKNSPLKLHAKSTKT